MRTAARSIAAHTLVGLVLLAGLAHAADPATAVYWSAEKTQEIMRDIATRVNKENGQSPQRFGDSMFIMHRERPREPRRTSTPRTSSSSTAAPGRS